MMLIGWEIIWDWLLTSYKKVTPKEFALLWATFLAICLGPSFPSTPPCASLHRLTSCILLRLPSAALFTPMPARLPSACRGS